MTAHTDIFKAQPALRPLTETQLHGHRHAKDAHPGMVWVGGGSFRMGSDHHYMEEAPSHRATVEGFWIDRLPVTNRDFDRFVAATGHVTAAEQAPDPANYPGAKPELLVPASVVFRKPGGPVDMGNHLNWWSYVPGADWRHPEGPGTSILGRMDHPVVHIAYDDAAAYAAWVGKTLPTETEWEFAARGGLDGADYAWGDSFRPEGRWMANVWHGAFPHEDRKEAGFGTMPAGAFLPNGYGIYDMIGNVWEWTSDWYSAHYQQDGNCCGARERSRDGSGMARKVMKGGSFLCAPNYCRRYRPAARMAQPIDTATCHLGFRCVVRGGAAAIEAGIA